jgi:CBS domain-containing protein
MRWRADDARGLPGRPAPHRALAGDLRVLPIAVPMMSTMPVSELVGDEVLCIAPDADLVAVADALTTNDVGVLVVGEPNEVRGVVSERDIVHVLAEGRDPTQVSAEDVANTDLAWCDAGATITEVAAEMMDRYVRHVLVEARGRLVGIVSARDLLGAYAATDSESAV